MGGVSGGIRRRLTLLLVAFGALGILLSESALAEPANITQARQEAEALWARIDELNEQLSAIVEEYDYALAQLSETQAAAQTTKLQFAQAEADLDLANGQLANRLVEIYKEGQLSPLEALLGAGSISEVVDRLDWMERMSGQDARLVADVEDYRGEKETLSTQLARQLEEQQALAAAAEAVKSKVEDKLAANEAALADKKDAIARLVKEEEQRQARLREAARKAAEEAKKLPNRLVAFATGFVGRPYVWGASGPSSFDCSGLVQYVYKQFGFNLPHSSAMQARLGKAVARDSLRLGDLIFFYSPIHHVGIYIGGGQMVHAAGASRGVRIDTVASHRSYNCARRIIP